NAARPAIESSFGHRRIPSGRSRQDHPGLAMNLGFVGYGSIAEEHVKAFRQIPEIELEVVVGRVPEATERFAHGAGFRRYTLDLQEAVENERVDAVVITSPSDLHAEQTEIC